MRSLAVITAACAVITLGGCTLFNSIFGSTSASIVAFSMDGIVGNAVLDAAQRTVKVTVQPMDISTVTPSVTVSTGATYTSSPLEDGTAVPFTVISQQGASQVWNVTVNVESGISFTYDSTHKVLTSGYEDLNAVYTPAQVGNGQPVAYWDGSDSYEDAYTALKQIPWDDTTQEMASVGFTGQASGSYDESTGAYFEYFEPVSALDLMDNTTFNIEVSRYGQTGEIFEGTFSGSTIDRASVSHPVTNGFFKGLMMSDSTPFLVGSGG